AQRQPETFFKNRIGLSDSDIQKMDQGQVVTKVLESGDKKYGILVFGGVYVNTSIEKFAASYRDVKGVLVDKVYIAVHAFNEVASPRKLSDFERLAFDRKDIDAVQKCKLDNCDLHGFDVAAFQMQTWRSQLSGLHFCIASISLRSNARRSKSESLGGEPTSLNACTSRYTLSSRSPFTSR